MALSQKDLDGTYMITTVSDYTGPLTLQSDGETVIVDGMTNRVDAKGCRWNTRLTLLNDDVVLFESVADPSEADGDFCLPAADGTPTRQPVTYNATLSVARKGERIRLSGKIEHGKILTLITMMKI